jgi:UDP-glucose 4-epimerase
MNTKLVLVTGCNGYIGSHVCKLLKENGHTVVGWDIDVYGESNNVFDYLDHFERIDVLKIPKRFAFDAVIHLAGLTSVEQSTQQPWEFYHTNIVGTNCVLDNVKTNHFLFASTASAWEMASPYAKSKVAAEDIIRQKTDNYTIFRFFNVSGTDGCFKQLGKATHLIRVAAEVAAGKREWITVYGNDYDTRDGTCIRDYVHVMDLAHALVNSLQQGPSRTPYECIGSNHGHSVLEVIETMRTVTNHSVPVVIGPRRPGDAVVSVVDTLSNLVQLRYNLEHMCLSQYNLELGRL